LAFEPPLQVLVHVGKLKSYPGLRSNCLYLAMHAEGEPVDLEGQLYRSAAREALRIL
jgi:hypothetical protein